MAWPYVACYHRSGGSNLTPNRVVVHCTVSPCILGGAMNTARYFQSSGSGGSAHKVVDPGGVVVCAADDVITWHAPPNQRSLGIELCDPMTGGTERWQDGNHQAMLRLAAVEVRNWCIQYNIPITKIGPPQLLAGQRGNCGHADVSQAWHQTDHWDPGPDFPWAQFIGMVLGVQPIKKEDDDMADAATQATLGRIELNAVSAARDSARVNGWLSESAYKEQITYLFAKYLGRSPDAGGMASFLDAAHRGATYAEVESAIANSAEARRRK